MDLSFHTFPYHTRELQEEEQIIIDHLLKHYPNAIPTTELLDLFKGKTTDAERVINNKIIFMLITRLIREKKLRRYQPSRHPTGRPVGWNLVYHRVHGAKPAPPFPKIKKIQADLIRLQEGFAQAIFQQKETDSGCGAAHNSSDA